MRKKINQEFLKQLKTRILGNVNNRYTSLIHHKSYTLLSATLLDIKRPFTNICIHSQSAASLVQQLIIKNTHQRLTKYNINIADEFGSSHQLPNIQNIVKQANITNAQIEIGIENAIQGGLWNANERKYDLIVSDLQLHTCLNPQNLLSGYQSSLKEDGAMIGCCYGEGTLRQLYWSYLMAQNQRSGGVSPKVATFPSMGVLGNLLTSTHFHLSTIIDVEQTVAFQSVIDLLSVIQETGESGYLEGRRKGVYKDLLLAMCALYQAQFRDTEDSIYATIQMLNFIGWKYSQTQPKPLKRGQKSVNFVDELRQIDSQLKHYRINDLDQNIQQIK